MRSKNGTVVRLPMLFGPTHKKQIVSTLLNRIKKRKKTYIAHDVYSTPVYSPVLCKFVYDNLLIKNMFSKKKLIHFSSNRLYSVYDLIILLSKKIKNRDMSKVFKVKDSFFNTKVDIKPKNLGLKSIYPRYIQKIDLKKIDDLL